MYLNNFFVYGTLLPGMDNYFRFIEKFNPQVYKARTWGVMYYLPRDGYPVVKDGKREIKGVLFVTGELPTILTRIDEIHKYTGLESQSRLVREIRDVEIMDTGHKVKAHIYMWPASRTRWLKKYGVIITGGDWARFLQNEDRECR